MPRQTLLINFNILPVFVDNNALDYKLAVSVGAYFRLQTSQMENIIEEVTTAVKNWRKMAKAMGIPNSEQELMAKAFNV